jgi:hypothetical protein
MKISRFALLVTLLLSSSIALAQQAATPAPAAAAQQPPLTAEQQAQLARQDSEMSGAAAQVIQLVDQGKMAELWDGASPVAKAVVTRQDFVTQVSADRTRLGAPTERKQVAVTRAAYAAGGQVPAGNYINVVFATRFANVAEPVRELVSFHLDDDKTWRVSGYSVR